ncbi:hypothetical protein GBZ48_31545 [Azospirillum melinis]|uniref:Uncharacterized protein n=1 Tax=Azospirillum melinis TaxID=328839 RepID=A0ABX2KJG7_9PROT|nr:hypothetical protein [Azospirillum melinis]MBP2310488.1 hypothetical protein [Azospirillum melinis]NUB03752.1 hypothetical protein [Azospirillum melinis]
MPTVKDRVKQTTTSTGTGTVALTGTVQGFQTFAQAVPSGTQVYYCIADGTDWETGIGTFTAGSPGSLSRDTILDSSNSSTLVSWGVGTKDVFITIPATVINNAAGLVCVEKTANGPLVKSQSFIANSASRLSFPLPSTAAVGDRFEVIGKGAGGWQITQAAGQTIRYGTRSTSAVANDGIMATNRYDAVELVCTVANTEFVVVDASGQPSVVGETGYTLSVHTGGQFTPTTYPTHTIFAYSMTSGSMRSVGTLATANLMATCAVHDANTAWTIAGQLIAWSTATREVQRFPFATETAAVTASQSVNGASSNGLGVDSSAAVNKGFRMRWYQPDLGNAFNYVEKLTYTTEAMAASSASMASTAERAGAMMTGTLSYIYCPDRSNNIAKFDNSTETLAYDYRYPDNSGTEGCSCSQSTSKGYRQGGWNNSSINAFTFASEAAVTIAATTHTYGYSANHCNATKAFCVGGTPAGYWYGSTSVRSLTFVSETSNTEAALTNSFNRYNDNSVQNGGYY